MKSRFWVFLTDKDVGAEISIGRRRLILTTIAIIVFLFVGITAIFYAMFNREGMLSVVSSPDGAQVYIDGLIAGPTPLTLSKKNGRHSIRVSKEGYTALPESLSVQIDHLVTTVAKFNLLPLEGTVPPPIPTTTVVNQPTTKYPDLPRRDESFPPLNPTTAPLDAAARAHQIAIVSVTSVPPGAVIWVDDHSTNNTTPATLNLELGVHRISVKKPDFSSAEGEQVVSLMIPGSTYKLAYTLIADGGSKFGKIIVATRPIAGKILIDGIERGTGLAQLEHIPYGSYNVTFQPVDGYLTPLPRKVAIDPTDATASIEAIYEPVVSISVSFDSHGQLLVNSATVNTGVFVNGSFVRDEANGPVKKFFSDNNMWAWEFGFGYANRNPSGTDAAEIRFQLPEAVAKNALKLRLYGYATSRNYPLTISGKNRITVELNGRTVASEIVPTRNIDSEDPPGYDEWRIGAWLVSGENKLIIRTSDRSAAYYLLNRIAIL